ncbi:hypothetical protein [Blastococcus brunescens]|uniref:Uncharacterized protein n=1 Tax=Blastococcus brunescens TaxID=1564165 RepID=A0ABZ1B890_9ACTN|nr:hypothetical protein [Blastococcus sp. BMG 8361]WRL66336.1 hypothetical protein U6N30_13370 [Blastococcus sp. BMG 8361]
MQLYASSPVQRTRQLAADLGLLAWFVLWVLIARVVHGAVLVLAEPGLAVEDLGRSVAGNMGSAAGVAEDVPWSATSCRLPSRRCPTRADRSRVPVRPRRTPWAPWRRSWPSSWWCCRSAGCWRAGCRGGCAGRAMRARPGRCSTARPICTCWPPGRSRRHRSPARRPPRGYRRGLAGRRPGRGARPGGVELERLGLRLPPGDPLRAG